MDAWETAYELANKIYDFANPTFEDEFYSAYGGGNIGY